MIGVVVDLVWGAGDRNRDHNRWNRRSPKLRPPSPKSEVPQFLAPLIPAVVASITAAATTTPTGVGDDDRGRCRPRLGRLRSPPLAPSSFGP
ncbi:hypothetical protein CDL15_Pgr022809 [Punica granatum]|nr:hypothetical protein CDL15_Pgr022809 [Punica granatum]